MKIGFDKLPAQLTKGLAPIYVVSGDEPLQHMEACDAIRAHARQAGCSERLVFEAEPGAWDGAGLLEARDSLSLFAEQRLLELRLPSGKAGDAAKTLVDYAACPAAGDVLLVMLPKLDKDAQKSKWASTLEQAGVWITVWPVEPAALPKWIEQRMVAHGLQPTAEASALLAAQVEGNLLAAVQEIDKLSLLYGAGPLTAEAVAEAVADSARYTIFDLVDYALKGEADEVAHVLAGLRGEGEEPILILWALVREIRTLAKLAADLRHGGAVEALMNQYRVWDKRKALIKKALQRHPSAAWRAMLRRASQIDRIIKGYQAGAVWDELLQLALFMGGVKYLNPVRQLA